MHAKCNAFVTLTLQTHKSNVCYVCAPQWLSRHATNSEHHYSVYVILCFLHIFMHLNISDDLFSYAVRIQLAPVKFCYGNALHGKRALTNPIHIPHPLFYWQYTQNTTLSRQFVLLLLFFSRLQRITKKCIAQQQQQQRWLQLRRHCYIKKNQWIPIVWMYSMPMFSDTFVALFFHIGHFSKFICISQTCSMFLDES